MMTVDKPRAKVPREPRRDMHKQMGWITVDNGTTRRECVVLDVSPGGAKVVTDAAIDVTGIEGLGVVVVVVIEEAIIPLLGFVINVVVGIVVVLLVNGNESSINTGPV